MFDLSRTERHLSRMGEREQAYAESFADEFGADWEMREDFGVRFLSERDFAPEDVDEEAVSDEDWQAFLEMSWVDPAERDLG